MAPLISVVIPAYNATRHLAHTLASVSAQSYQNIEIIAVDDGSRDGTAELVRAHTLQDPRARLVRKANGGVASARNAGIHEAAGELVAPVVADDLWHSRKLELQVDRLSQAGANVGLVYTGHVVLDEDGRVVRMPVRFAVEEGVVHHPLVMGNFVGNASTPLMPRSCVLAAGGYDESLRARGAEGCEDYKLYLEIARHHRFAAVPSGLVGYRRSGSNMSRDVYRMKRSHHLVMEEFREILADVPERFWRWSEAGMCTWLAGCAREGPGGLRVAMALLARAVARDPYIGATAFLRWLEGRGGRVLGRTAEEPGSLIGRDYFDLSLDELERLPLESGGLARRRSRYLASVASAFPEVQGASPANAMDRVGVRAG